MIMKERDMIKIFDTCGRGLNGDFPRDILVDTKKMRIVKVDKPLGDTETMPLRALLFAMDAIVENRLVEIFDGLEDDDDDFDDFEEDFLLQGFAEMQTFIQDKVQSIIRGKWQLP